MRSIGNLISPVVKSLGLEGALRLEEMQKEWTALFGEPLSLHMFPAGLRNDELLITVDSPVWLQQISFYKKDIIEKLNAFHIAEVRFRLGKMRRSKELRRRPASPLRGKALDEHTLHFIEETVSAIEDDTLRKGISRVMQRAFSRKPCP